MKRALLRAKLTVSVFESTVISVVIDVSTLITADFDHFLAFRR